MTLVCRVPRHVEIDVESLRALLQSRIDARAARAEQEVSVTPSLIRRWVREEMDQLVAQIETARRLAHPEH